MLIFIDWWWNWYWRVSKDENQKAAIPREIERTEGRPWWRPDHSDAWLQVLPHSSMFPCFPIKLGGSSPCLEVSTWFSHQIWKCGLVSPWFRLSDLHFTLMALRSWWSDLHREGEFLNDTIGRWNVPFRGNFVGITFKTCQVFDGGQIPNTWLMFAFFCSDIYKPPNHAMFRIQKSKMPQNYDHPWGFGVPKTCMGIPQFWTWQDHGFHNWHRQDHSEMAI